LDHFILGLFANVTVRFFQELKGGHFGAESRAARCDRSGQQGREFPILSGSDAFHNLIILVVAATDNPQRCTPPAKLRPPFKWMLPIRTHHGELATLSPQTTFYVRGRDVQLSITPRSSRVNARSTQSIAAPQTFRNVMQTHFSPRREPMQFYRGPHLVPFRKATKSASS
jgi:hypothetical protein